MGQYFLWMVPKLSILFYSIDSRINKVLEQTDDGVILADKKDNSDLRQMWTRYTVDELDNWFIWSNADVNENKFLAATSQETLQMKGMFCTGAIISPL